MEISDALAFARRERNGILSTLKRDGRAQLSTVAYYVGEDDAVRISLTDDRAKARNMRRDPRISLFVTAPDYASYVVFEAEAELTPPAVKPDDETAEALVAYYRELVGEHPDWDEYRAAMVTDRRLILTIRPTHAYGLNARTWDTPKTTS
ncbi:MAG: PPOX class F420-dependent oxidoreductase [Actinomycetota bacterium]|nr:PPOX class F420-dependent oxidoreductase [Actinomycetota bacterium]